MDDVDALIAASRCLHALLVYKRGIGIHNTTELDKRNLVPEA
jgi:hypothetical protein